MTQYSPFKLEKPIHGGDHNAGKRKTRRPLAKQRPIHLTLKAKEAFKNDDGAIVLKETQRLAEKFQLRIYGHAVADDHLHLVITIPGRREYNFFIRSVSGLLARRFGKGIWSVAPFTRVGHWGKDFRTMQKYVEKNQLEASGDLPYKDRFFKPEWI